MATATHKNPRSLICIEFNLNYSCVETGEPNTGGCEFLGVNKKDAQMACKFVTKDSTEGINQHVT